eukprot:Gb_06136 [translate_table: standard]
MAWDKVCLEKKSGGISLRNLKDMNKDLIGKLVWKLVTMESSVWTRILRAKYLGSLREFLGQNPLPQGSMFWNNLQMCRDLLSKGTRWKIGNGQNVDFWNDAWLEEVPLNNHPLLSNIKTLIPEGCKVSQLISPSEYGRTWTQLNFQNPSLAEKEAQFFLNQRLKVLPLSQQGQDSLIWGKTSNGLYSVSSTYLSLHKEEPLWDLAPRIWIRMLIPKVATFS